MKTYKATTINGEPKLEPVNPCKHYNIDYSQNWENGELDAYENANDRHDRFKRANPPIDYVGPDIPEGTILDESELEIRYQELNEDDEWEHCSVETYNHLYAKGITTRRVATLKAKPYYSNAMDYNNDMLPMKGICDQSDLAKSFDAKKKKGVYEKQWEKEFPIKRVSTPSNSEEGEQPMKEDWKRLYQNLISLSQEVSDLLESGDTVKAKWTLDTIVKNGNWLLTKK